MDFHRIKKLALTHHTSPKSEWKGAVVFLCSEKNVFFIKRSELMPTHGGQVAFVGGHRLPGEESPWEVAQREYQEETSLAPSSIEYLGYLPEVMTARMQPIVPVLARLAIPEGEFLIGVKSNGEWDDLMVYPWCEIQREENWGYAWRHGYSENPVLFHSLSEGSYRSLNGERGPRLLWGATAGMVWSFLRLYFDDEMLLGSSTKGI